jgi:hypothetical protein
MSFWKRVFESAEVGPELTSKEFDGSDVLVRPYVRRDFNAVFRLWEDHFFEEVHHRSVNPRDVEVITRHLVGEVPSTIWVATFKEAVVGFLGGECPQFCVNAVPLVSASLFGASSFLLVTLMPRIIGIILAGGGRRQGRAERVHRRAVGGQCLVQSVLLGAGYQNGNVRLGIGSSQRNGIQMNRSSSLIMGLRFSVPKSTLSATRASIIVTQTQNRTTGNSGRIE